MRRSIGTLLLISLLSSLTPLAVRDRDRGDFYPIKIIKRIIRTLLPLDTGGMPGPPKP